MMEALLYSAIAPFGLLLLSSIWQYPPVLEEVVKWSIIKSKVHQVRQVHQVCILGAQVGLVFGLSEAVLYSINIWTYGDWKVMIWRLLFTVPMHAVTAGMIGWGMDKRMGYLGLCCAILLHSIFNYVMG